MEHRHYNLERTDSDLKSKSTQKSVRELCKLYEHKAEGSKNRDKGEIKEKEKDLARMKEKIDSLAEQINDLKNGQFGSNKLYSRKNDKLYPILLAWHEQIQAAKLENLETHKILENIEKLQDKMREEIFNINKYINIFHNKYFNDIKHGSKTNNAIKTIKDRYQSLLEDFKACTEQFKADELILEKMRDHQNGPDVKSLIERQGFLDNLRAFLTKKRQDNEAFGVEREKIQNTRHAFLDAMMKQVSETSEITLPKEFKVDPETNEITLPEEFKVDSAGSKGLFTELCYKLAQKNFYTLVRDSSGHPIFTPKMYESFRIENLKGGIKTVFDKTPFSPEGLINKLEENRYLAELYQGDVGVWEGYTLRQHTLMVMDRFEQYCAESWNSSVLTKDDFRLMLALHDIGKPQAVKETGGTSAQHAYTLRIVPEVLKQLGISEDKARVMASIIGQDYIGSQMKRHIPLGGLLWRTYSKKDAELILDKTKEDAKNISAKAEELGIGTAEYFELMKVYYQCDAASYTKDAPGGKRALDHLFEFTEDPVSGRKTMEFSKLAKRAFSILDNYVKEEDLERERRSTGTVD